MGDFIRIHIKEAGVIRRRNVHDTRAHWLPVNRDVDDVAEAGHSFPVLDLGNLVVDLADAPKLYMTDFRLKNS